MNSVMRRTSARLVASNPNYLEVTCLLLTVATIRLLHLSFVWNAIWQACVGITLVVLAFVYGCLGKGQLFQYLGWIQPRRAVYWLYAPLAGIGGALLAIYAIRLGGSGLGHAPASTLLYGVTLGPIVEEILYRGLAFSGVYVLACSFKVAGTWRFIITIVATAVVFAGSHRTSGALPFFLIFGMGLGYGLMRWRARSTAASALMHIAYNLTVAAAMSLS